MGRRTVRIRMLGGTLVTIEATYYHQKSDSKSRSKKGLYPKLILLGIHDRCTPALCSRASLFATAACSLKEAQQLEESTGHFGELINVAEQAISEYFQTTIHVSKVIQLSEPDRRNLILRLLINQAATGIPGSIILKKTAVEKQIFEKGEQETEAEQRSRFAHDWAGLQFLTQLNSRCAPLFYAGNLEHKFILIEDLGVEHHSLVDPLTRTNSPANQQEAELALLNYMRNLGKLHAETAMKSQLFSSILQRIYPESSRLHFPDSEIPSVIKRFNILSKDKLNELKKEIEGLVTNFIQ